MPEAQPELLPAGAAFDAVAATFDARFEPWRSVAAQRRAVRAELLAAFAAGADVLEIGGGTGLDAAWLAAQGRRVHLTDASPAMVAEAARKLGTGQAEVLAAENLARLAARGELFDGVFSNFAALNCIHDLAPVGEALGALIRPGGKAVLVVFGCCAPGEMLVEAARGRFGTMFRRFARGDVPARLGGRDFTVRYHRRAAIVAAMTPWFRLTGTRAIGLSVPPSAAEPWISHRPRLLAVLETADRLLSRPLAPLGDHILYMFERLPA